MRRETGWLSVCVVVGLVQSACGRIAYDRTSGAGDPDSGGPGTPDADVVPTTCAASLGSGRLHSCVITGGNELYCWGENIEGQLGDGTMTSSNTPQLIGAMYADVMGGRRSTCAARLDGSRACWGENTSGQLGIGTQSTREVSPSSLAGESITFQRMAHGAVHGCGITADSTVYCWGSNNSGRLGTVDRSDSLVPRQLDLEPIDVLEAGGSTTCAIASSGSFYCWGNGAEGSCGDGNNEHCLLPTELPSLSGASAVSFRDQHGCAVLAGEAYCWGTNSSGESGHIGPSVLSPTLVAGGSGFTALSMGNHHSCALHSSGQVFCWGENGQGELGDGSTTDREMPAPVMGITDAIEITGASFSTCARLADYNVVCWGRNTEGQLGAGLSDQFATEPVLAFPCN